jgi:hypothetical protein
VDISALLMEMEAAGKKNAEVERARAQAQSFRQEILRDRLEAKSLREKAEKLLLEAKRLDEKADDEERSCNDAPELPGPIDTAALRQQIESAHGVNAQIEARQRRAGILADREKLETESVALTVLMDKRTADRQQAIASAAMPVPGLSFGAGEVIYNSLPFAQASSAEQLRVSVAIAMRANPKLRVLRITDGSLLDEASLRLIADMADADDFQIWIERVDTSGKVGIYLEDGEVRGEGAVHANN